MLTMRKLHRIYSFFYGKEKINYYTYLTLSCRCICNFSSICSIGNWGTSYGADISFGKVGPFGVPGGKLALAASAVGESIPVMNKTNKN